MSKGFLLKISAVIATLLVLVPAVVLADTGIKDFFFYNYLKKLAYSSPVITQWVFGSTTTTTNNRVEIYGDAYVSSTLTTGNLNATNVSSTNLTATTLNLTGALLDSTNATGTSGQLLSSTGTSTQWISTSSLGIITTETDPIWSAVSTTVAYLSNNQAFTGENTFTATTSLSYGSWIGDTLGSKSIQFTDYTIPTTFAAGNQVNKISAKNDLNFLAMENALFVFADTGEDPLIGFGREDSNYLTLMGTNLEDNTLSIYQIDETVTQVNYSDFAIGTEKISLISGSVTSTLNFNNNAEINLSPTDIMNFSGASGYYFDATTTASCLSNDGINCFANLWFQNGSDIYYDGGFVGIGTTTPQAPLHLVTTNTTEPVLILGNSTNIAGPKAISIGYGAEAMGTSSLAMGDDSDADGENSVSIGKDSIAMGLNSTAIGKSASAKGYYSLALGNFVNASNTYAIAIGNNQTITGEGAIGLGFNGNVSGAYSASIAGNNNNVSGLLAGNFGGFYNNVSGIQSVGLGGQYNTVSGNNAAIIASQGSQATGIGSFISGGASNISSGNYTSAISSISSVSQGTLSGNYNTRYSTSSGVGSMNIGGEYNEVSGFAGGALLSANMYISGYGAIGIVSGTSTITGYGGVMTNSIYSNISADGSSIHNSTAVNVSSTYSMVIDTIYSNIHDTAPFSFIANASNTNIYGPRSVVVGGDDHTITNAYSMILGGQRNTVSGMFSYAMGSDMTVSSPNSFGINLAPYYAPATSTLAQTSTLAIMGGSVGIGTTTPTYNLTIDSSSNWFSMSRSDGYGINFTWETSTVDYPLISGLASSSAVLGGDLEGVGIKNAMLLVSDSAPSIVFSTYTNIFTALAQIAFDVATEIMGFSGAKSFKWFDYDTGESEVFIIDAENSDVYIPSIPSCGVLGTDANGKIICND